MSSIAYLYSRFPVLSQTFCLTEMLGLQRQGVRLVVGSINPPADAFRHGLMRDLDAPLLYAPPSKVRRQLEEDARRTGRWPGERVRQHEERYGPDFKAAERARNALWFADQFQRHQVEHVHVHFANRATHTALFLKEISGIPFSFTAHAQDFMVDLGSDQLLAELCNEATFVAAVSNFSRDLLQQKCPDAADKIVRIYNGMDLSLFPEPEEKEEPPLILSIGRLIEFKGFDILIRACALLQDRGTDFRCQIVGEGPLKANLQRLIDELGVAERVELTGPLSQETVRQRLARSALFALACRIDSKGASDILPTVILEAMATRLPVVSTTLVGVPEMVDSGQNGLLTPPDDPEAFARALEQVLKDPEQRIAMGKQGRAKVEKTFSVEVTSRALLEKMGGVPQPGPVPRAAWLFSVWPDDVDWISQLERDWIARGEVVAFCLTQGKISKRRPPALPGGALIFLPGPEVLEGEYNQSFPAENGSGVASTEEDATAIRQAWFLGRELEKRGVSHLHAVGNEAAQLARLARELKDLKISLTLPQAPAPSDGKAFAGKDVPVRTFAPCPDAGPHWISLPSPRSFPGRMHRRLLPGIRRREEAWVESLLSS